MEQQKLFLVGGSVQANQNLTRHLDEMGVAVTGSALTVSELGSIPVNSTAALLLIDQVSHSLKNKLDGQAFAQGMRVYTGYAMSWTRTQKRLEDAGVLPCPVYGQEVLVVNGTNDQRERTVRNTKHIERSKRIREVVRSVCEKNKDRLSTYTSEELAVDVSTALGDTISPSTAGNWRSKLGYAVPPKGFKRPRVKAVPAVAELPVVKTDVKENTDAELQTIVDMLKEWIKAAKVTKLYVAFDSTLGEGVDVNMERTVTTSHTVKL